jgi:peptidyl-prolyl cis-trans isomerase A (cyclophilin A)
MYFYSISKAVNFCFKSAHQILLAVCAILFVPMVQATTVQFQTVMGDFEVNLYDKATPETVKNFLAYVRAGAYKNTVVHRVVPQFVVQAGGFKFEEKLPLALVATNPAVINEPVFSNKRGTIAMAKQSGNANSATNQWFFNLGDNSKDLDKDNGGFTVFGEVTGNGMGIIDSISQLTIFQFDSPFESMPLQKFTRADVENKVELSFENFVIIRDIVILDSSIDTADKLTPVKNTSANVTNPNTGSKSSSGGGFIDLLPLIFILMFGLTRVKGSL